MGSIGAATIYIVPGWRTRSIVLGETTGLVLGGFASFVFVLSRTFAKHRQPAFKSAQNLLLERIRCGRAVRNLGYDLFLPPPPTTTTTPTTTTNAEAKDTVGLLFYPGPLVNHTAYAPIMTQLSDAGILVCVISLEPMRINVEPRIEEVVKRTLNVMNEIIATHDDYEVSTWAIGGHSSGGNIAMDLAARMTPGISKLVLWGKVMKETSPAKDISLRDAALDALVLNGTEDRIVDSTTEWSRNTLRDMLPPQKKEKEDGRECNMSRGLTIYTNIDGGNNAGFGHYGPQTFPKDGTRSITLDDQQKITIEHTANFLLKHKITRD